MELSQTFIQDISDPVLQGLTVQGVEVTPDLSIARIFYVLPAKKTDRELAKAFKRVEPFLRSGLAKKLNLRHVPRFEFIEDEQTNSMARLHHLFQENGLSSFNQ